MPIDPRRELELRRRLQAETPQFRPQKSNAPQCEAFNSDADEIGYGGAAGGGKTFLGFMMAMYKHWHSVVFRRNLDQHGALIEIIRGFDEKHLKGYPPVYRPDNSTRKVKAKKIQFAHLDHESDLEKHQGKAKDFLWFDEAVHFHRHEIQRLAAHLRPLEPLNFAGSGLKCQLLLTFNPPLDQRGLWVLDMFGPWINSDHPMYPQPSGKVLYCCYWNGTDYFYESDEPLTHDPATGQPLDAVINLKSRTFFKAMLSDNEALKNNVAYIATLQGMSEVERRAFLDGEMTASLVDEAGQIVKRKSWEAAVRRWPDAMKAVEKMPPLCISIDIASGGEDHFVCMPFWKYGHAGMPHGIEGKHVGNPQLQVAHVEQYMFDVLHTSPDQTAIIYDASGGWGSGFAEVWRTKYPNGQLIPFEGGKAAGINQIYNGIGKDEQLGELSGMPKASGPIGFQNRIGAAWYRAGEMLDHPMFQLAVPPHTRLAKEAQSRLVEERNGKLITIESKEKISKKLNHSPDYADAWVMGLWYLSVELRIVGKK